METAAPALLSILSPAMMVLRSWICVPIMKAMAKITEMVPMTIITGTVEPKAKPKI